MFRRARTRWIQPIARAARFARNAFGAFGSCRELTIVPEDQRVPSALASRLSRRGRWRAYSRRHKQPPQGQHDDGHHHPGEREPEQVKSTFTSQAGQRPYGAARGGTGGSGGSVWRSSVGIVTPRSAAVASGTTTQIYSSIRVAADSMWTQTDTAAALVVFGYYLETNHPPYAKASAKIRVRYCELAERIAGPSNKLTMEFIKLSHQSVAAEQPATFFVGQHPVRTLWHSLCFSDQRKVQISFYLGYKPDPNDPGKARIFRTNYLEFVLSEASRAGEDWPVPRLAGVQGLHSSLCARVGGSHREPARLRKTPRHFIGSFGAPTNPDIARRLLKALSLSGNIRLGLQGASCPRIGPSPQEQIARRSDVTAEPPLPDASGPRADLRTCSKRTLPAIRISSRARLRSPSCSPLPSSIIRCPPAHPPDSPADFPLSVRSELVSSTDLPLGPGFSRHGFASL